MLVDDRAQGGIVLVESGAGALDAVEGIRGGARNTARSERLSGARGTAAGSATVQPCQGGCLMSAGAIEWVRM